MLKSRLPEIAASIPTRMEVAVRLAADDIAGRARDRVPIGPTHNLHDSIRVERQAHEEYAVLAGDTQAFYAALVEFGTRKNPARPYMTPAAAEAGPGIQAIGAAALKDL